MNPSSVEKVLWVKRGQGIAACGFIPREEEFFKDHFPGFPILPGVLALEMLKQTAELYFQGAGNESDNVFVLKQIRAVKFSSYLKPGDAWESHLELVSETSEESQWNARLMNRGQVAVSARLTLARKRILQTQSV